MRDAAQRWFRERTSSSSDWPADHLREIKGSTRVSVIIPALNEEATIGPIVRTVKAVAGLADEVIVMDSGSSDRTSDLAREAGAMVHHRDDVLPDLGSRPGKGEVLWKSLAVTSGDIVVYVDGDIKNFAPHFLSGLLGPLLTFPDVLLVKGFYDRPLRDVSATGGGRVTELVARPLINTYFPDLAGVVQPLSGEYAARRSLLESLPFAGGYGVEIGLLIDTFIGHGLAALAQVDLGERQHSHQDTAALGVMSATILHTVLARVSPGQTRDTDITQFERRDGIMRPVTSPVPTDPRPPMIRTQCPSE